jgi:acyl carrier protein
MVIKDHIKKYIVETFLYGNEDGLMDDTSFSETGIVDSTGILEIIAFLEEEFSIHIKDDELTLENLDSIALISRFIEYKLNPQ